ncbi:MAG: DUF4149 domain-containing protein [Planctomycetes bacterium]|nr:DUF4149 domain-containing protein [Planctomycetota bacterium]
MLRFLHSALILTAALWIGGLAALAFVVAPIVFRTAGSRELAGTIFGTILRTFTWVEVVLALIAAVSMAVFLILSRPPAPLDWARAGLLSALILLLVGTMFVNSAAAETRPQCGSFDREPATAAEGEARVRFDRLHSWSVRLVGTQLLVGGLLLALSAGRRWG